MTSEDAAAVGMEDVNEDMDNIHADETLLTDANELLDESTSPLASMALVVYRDQPREAAEQLHVPIENSVVYHFRNTYGKAQPPLPASQRQLETLVMDIRSPTRRRPCTNTRYDRDRCYAEKRQRDAADAAAAAMEEPFTAEEYEDAYVTWSAQRAASKSQAIRTIVIQKRDQKRRRLLLQQE